MKDKLITTPGPWSFIEKTGMVQGEKTTFGIRAPYPFYSVIPTLNINKMDVILMSAAPDLLESTIGLHKALSRMIDKYDPDSIDAEWLSHSNNAIRKATGLDI